MTIHYLQYLKYYSIGSPGSHRTPGLLLEGKRGREKKERKKEKKRKEKEGPVNKQTKREYLGFIWGTPSAESKKRMTLSKSVLLRSVFVRR